MDETDQTKATGGALVRAQPGRPPAASPRPQPPAAAGPTRIDMTGIGTPAELTGTDDPWLAQLLADQVADCVPHDDSRPPKAAIARHKGAVAALKAVGPRDGFEGMLAAQMVAVHNIGLETLSRSAGRSDDPGLRHGARLLELFTRQMAAMERQRGRRRRRLRVERGRPEAEGKTTVEETREENL